MKQIIEEMYAFVATESDGSEGVIGMNMNEQWFPFMGADMDRVKSLYPFALKVGVPFRVMKFTNKVDITEEVKRVCET